MRLDRLLDEVEVVAEWGGPRAVEVSSVAYDSRNVHTGAVFCCLAGRTSDGHDHARAAVAAGAVALVVERMVDLDVPQVQVPAARPAMARLAAAFHRHPSRQVRVVGITGTNGKTTTSYLLQGILAAHGWPTAVIGTLTGRHTTPEAPELQSALAGFRDDGRSAVVMEVSSEALAQNRADAVWFAAAVFTNLSAEHLNFHGDIESYFAAKAALFDPGRAAVGVVNADDRWGRRLLAAAPIDMVPWSLADAHGLRTTERGSAFSWDGAPVELPLPGRFNAANAVAAATAARVLGVAAPTVAAGLSAVAPIPGRFENVDAGQRFSVVVDFAHTPVALEQVLQAARERADGRVLVVFGCGGDRDPAKRPVMGAVAARLADIAVVTSDNPRGEDPADIVAQVRAGAPGALLVEVDRRKAIARVVSMA
ncbi:MAG: UDP-N-acetylmuramoyl-L-alanyl-D-glutamate--2,6-diaminopimelate ligase, partial [Acidimicrobiales bacterium]